MHEAETENIEELRTKYEQVLELIVRLREEMQLNCCQSLLEADELVEEIDDLLKQLGEGKKIPL